MTLMRSREFIAKENVVAANMIVAQVLAICENLSWLPHQGHLRPELSSRPLRFVVVRDYLLAYAPDDVLYGSWRFRTANAIPASWLQFCAIEGSSQSIRRREWLSGGHFGDCDLAGC